MTWDKYSSEPIKPILLDDEKAQGVGPQKITSGDWNDGMLE
jgi:hypothetical protein